MTVGMIEQLDFHLQCLVSSLNNLDPGDVELMRMAISSMAVGMSTALHTCRLNCDINATCLL